MAGCQSSPERRKERSERCFCLAVALPLVAVWVLLRLADLQFSSVSFCPTCCCSVKGTKRDEHEFQVMESLKYYMCSNSNFNKLLYTCDCNINETLHANSEWKMKFFSSVFLKKTSTKEEAWGVMSVFLSISEVFTLLKRFVFTDYRVHTLPFLRYTVQYMHWTQVQLVDSSNGPLKVLQGHITHTRTHIN